MGLGEHERGRGGRWGSFLRDAARGIGTGWMKRGFAPSTSRAVFCYFSQLIRFC